MLYQNKEKTEPSGGWNEKTSSTEKNKVKQVTEVLDCAETFFCPKVKIGCEVKVRATIRICIDEED